MKTLFAFLQRSKQPLQSTIRRAIKTNNKFRLVFTSSGGSNTETSFVTYIFAFQSTALTFKVFGFRLANVEDYTASLRDFLQPKHKLHVILVKRDAQMYVEYNTNAALKAAIEHFLVELDLPGLFSIEGNAYLNEKTLTSAGMKRFAE